MKVHEEVKRRKRNPLEPTAHEIRQSARSQLKEYWLEGKAVEVTPDLIASKHIRAKIGAAAAAKTWFRGSDDYNPDDNLHVKSLTRNSEDADQVRYPSFYTDRKSAIRFLHYHIFCAPDPDDWHKMKLIPSTCHLLNIPNNSHTSIRTLLWNIVETENFEEFKNKQGAGRIPLIIHVTIQADIIYTALLRNLTTKEATCILNMYRAKNGLFILSRSALQGFKIGN
jgi:hypothetical protein